MTDTDIHNAMEDATADYAELIESLASKLDGVHYTGIDFDQTMAAFNRQAHQQITRLYNSREPRD